MKKLLILIITSILLSSCASPYIGVRMYPDTWFPTYKPGSSQTGHRISELEHITVEFDYIIEEGNINFDGVITCNEDVLSPALATVELSMYVLFTDTNGTVVAHENFIALSDETFCGKAGSPRLFKATYPYNDYRGLKFGYQIRQFGY